MSDTSIRSASDQLADARRTARDKDADLDAAMAAHAALANRISELEGERADIAARRRAGQGDDAVDGGRLQIIAMDIDGLRELLAEPARELEGARRECEVASQRVGRAEQALARVEDESMLAKLVDHAGALDMLILATANEISALGKKLARSRDPWTPTAGLADCLHRLHLRRI